MAEIVNLREFRKQRARRGKTRQAAVNREKFGRTKAEIERERREQQSRDGALDGKRLDDDETK